MRPDGYRARMALIHALGMTEDEQTWTWGLLNELQLENNGVNTERCEALRAKIVRQVHRLRTDKGRAWMKAQRLDEDGL